MSGRLDLQSSESTFRDEQAQPWGLWDRFWFLPASIARSAMIRGLLGGITALYFLSCWRDAAFWYAGGGPFSTERVATFLQTSGLEDAATWILSPLFLAKSAWLYQLYLATGVVTALVVAAGRGGRLAAWCLWLLLVGWANRAMILSGLTETTLSLALFASAIAPAASPLAAFTAKRDPATDWTAGFSQRLMATQVTVILLATFATMLAGRVWFNGLGAYALAAPAMDRTINWTTSPLVQPNIHEGLTHLMMLALPTGLLMAWLDRTRRMGQLILLLWCLAIALLGSLWLYSATLATMVLVIGDLKPTDPFPPADRLPPANRLPPTAGA